MLEQLLYAATSLIKQSHLDGFELDDVIWASA